MDSAYNAILANRPPFFNSQDINSVPPVIPSYFNKEYINQLYYNPKEGKQILFEDLIYKGGNNFVPKYHSNEGMNFYLMKRPFLQVFLSPAYILPQQMNSPYSDFESLVGQLKFQEFKKADYEKQIRVILYENASKIKLIMKQFWIFADLNNNNNHHANELLDSFVSQKYNEYSLLQICSASPNTIKPIDFKIVYLPNAKLIVTELLQMYGGITLDHFFPKNNSQIISELFLQMVNELKFFELYKIEHNDIKSTNIVIEQLFGKFLIQFIDFDIAKQESLNSLDTKKFGRVGY